MGGISGQFAEVDLPQVAGIRWQVQYVDNSVVINAVDVALRQQFKCEHCELRVPEPSTGCTLGRARLACLLSAETNSHVHVRAERHPFIGSSSLSIPSTNASMMVNRASARMRQVEIPKSTTVNHQLEIQRKKMMPKTMSVVLLLAALLVCVGNASSAGNAWCRLPVRRFT